MTYPFPIPDNEEDRVTRLKEYEILDTPAEEAFDRLTRVAAHIFDAPISLVSLVDDDRQWFKSRYGLDAPETPRELAFCAHAIAENDVFVIPDATKDTRFASNPLVTTDPKIGFYAGAQLWTADGLGLGTLCVIDTEPRKPTDDQLAALKDLAALAMDALNLRRAGRMALDQAKQNIAIYDAKSEFIDNVNHELRTPLTSIAGSLRLLASGTVGELEEETKSFISIAERSSNTLLEIITDLLDMSALDKGEIELNLETFDLVEVVHRVVRDISGRSEQDSNRINVDRLSGSQAVFGDPVRLQQVIRHLVENALQFSPETAPVTLRPISNLGTTGLDVIDEGDGIPNHERTRVFGRFVKLDNSLSKAGSGKAGTGLGLSIAKGLVEAHGGVVRIQPNGDKGSVVSFEIPRNLVSQDQQTLPQ